MDKNDFDKKIKSFKKAVHREPHNARNYVDLIHAYLDHGKYNKAIEWYNQGCQAIDDDDILCNQIGYWYREKKLYNEAIKWYQKAITINPNEGYHYYGIGRSYRKLGKYNKALTWHKKGIECVPLDPCNYVGMGETYTDKLDDNKAITWYKKGVQHANPEYDYYTTCYEFMGEIYLK